MRFPADVTAPDGVDWFRDRGDAPTIVSLSDVHGYLDAARSALTAVGETEAHPPVVTVGDDGRLRWAGNDYLLLVNGDLVDRGPDNEACLDLVARLVDEAPPGRVRYHLGNHEMAVLFPAMFRWPGVFSVELERDPRERFVDAVASGALPAAFEGYEYTYSHAGSNDPIDVPAVNATAATAAEEAADALDGTQQAQRDIAAANSSVFGLGGVRGRGKDAGLLWMDFTHMRHEAPPQVVGHSRHERPTRKGNAVCQNVIRSSRASEGGEAVLLETPDGLTAVVREADGVSTMEV